jgi:hypothetical protein
MGWGRAVLEPITYRLARWRYLIGSEKQNKKQCAIGNTSPSECCTWAPVLPNTETQEGKNTEIYFTNLRIERDKIYKFAT